MRLILSIRPQLDTRSALSDVPYAIVCSNCSLDSDANEFEGRAVQLECCVSVDCVAEQGNKGSVYRAAHTYCTKIEGMYSSTYLGNIL